MSRGMWLPLGKKQLHKFMPLFFAPVHASACRVSMGKNVTGRVGEAGAPQGTCSSNH